jgi:predicted nucleotidyltransferase component of viral defense system
MTIISKESLKQRIRNITKFKNITPAQLWQNIVSERFLVRLVNSKYKNHFILKGGFLLSKYIEINRETHDIDFLVKRLKNDTNNIKNIFEEIARIEIQDGFDFNDIHINKLDHSHMKYLGYRILMKVFFGKSRFKMQIDLGFGDFIHPTKNTHLLTRDSKSSLFENQIEINCYPREFIFAEKLETIISRGILNSRMKDYHDLYSLILTKSVDDIYLKNVLKSVFRHRKTDLKTNILKELKENEQTKLFWKFYHKNLFNRDLIPSEINVIINLILKKLDKIIT